MTVKLNNIALTALLTARDGPVGLLVEHHAENILADAKANASTIMHRKPDAADAVRMHMDDNLRAIIGVIDTGSIARYLAEKSLGRVASRSEELWPQGWLKAAFDEEFHK